MQIYSKTTILCITSRQCTLAFHARIWYSVGKRHKVADRRRNPRNILILLANTGASCRDFLAGFSRFARGRPDWRVRLRHGSDLDDTSIERLTGPSGYDGIVTNEDVFLKHPELADNPRTAVVVFGTYREMAAPAPVIFVQNDNAIIGRFGARHFMQLGRFRTFGFVPTERQHAWSDIRAEAFGAELSAHAHGCSVFSWSGGVSLGDWLAELPKPVAVMAACDRVAIEVAAACSSSGLSVPDHVAVLGVDNDTLLCEFDSPTLSSILPKHDTTGWLAAKALNRLFRGWRPESAQRILCTETSVIERESTAPLSPATHLIQSALEFIRRNARKNISAQDVIQHLNVSPSLANLRFREFQKETIGEAIRRERLEEVCRSLATTRMSVRKVAQLCGFSNAAYLGALFRRQFGMSPGQWRLSKGAHDGAPS